MLRTLSLAAPVVAAIMIVVLIVEPPALRPAERLPTLRMLTARAAEGLDQRQVQDAIARGREGAPGSYVLHRVLPTGDQPPAVEPAGRPRSSSWTLRDHGSWISLFMIFVIFRGEIRQQHTGYARFIP